MEQAVWKKAFIDLLWEQKAIRFGTFVTKSQRVSPYFIDTGLVASGRALGQMAELYAKAVAAAFSLPLEGLHLFGPAYKGIALSVLVAENLYKLFGQDVLVTYNRKELKDHGEGGGLIGAPMRRGAKVLIIEDVLTGGTSIRDSVALLSPLGVELMGAFVGIDRMEKGVGELSAAKEIKQGLGFEVHSLVTIEELVFHLQNKRDKEGQLLIPPSFLELIHQYWLRYKGA